MFRNPFVDLGQPRLEQQGEEVEGAFTCQEFGCYETTREARYFEATGLLVWKCADGHKSEIKDFRIDW